MNANKYTVSLGGNGNFLKFIVVMVSQFYKYAKAIELYTLNG